MEKYTYGVKGEEYVLEKFKKCPIFKGIDTVTASGSQFYAKEDLRSDLFIIQVKTTEKQQYRINHKDYALLDSWGIKNNLIPIFAIYFEVYDIIKVAFDFTCLDLFKSHKLSLQKTVPVHSKNISISYLMTDQVFQLKEYPLYLTDAKNFSY